jgi:hypothetical protein
MPPDYFGRQKSINPLLARVYGMFADFYERGLAETEGFEPSIHVLARMLP